MDESQKYYTESEKLYTKYAVECHSYKVLEQSKLIYGRKIIYFIKYKTVNSTHG